VPKTITVTLDLAQAEAAIYALRCEAHRQEPAEYLDHSPRYPGYDPWPRDMSDLADELERQLIEAGISAT
jgi:hypothetical protein